MIPKRSTISASHVPALPACRVVPALGYLTRCRHRSCHFRASGNPDYRSPLCYTLLNLILLALCLAPLACDRNDQPGSQSQSQFEIKRQYQRGPLTVELEVEREQITIADSLQVRFSATLAPGYQLDMPTLTPTEYEFGIIDFTAAPDQLLPDKSILYRRTYRLEPIVSGNYSIPELRFIFHEQPTLDQAGQTVSADETSAAQQYELLTEAIEIEVTSLIDPDSSDLALADIKGVVPLPRPYHRTWLWALTLLPLAALALIITLLRKRRRTAQPHIFKPAHEIALDQLRRLESENLLTTGKVRQFYQRMSGILRRYIEHRFDLHAPERTTEEFILEAYASDALGSTHSDTLKKFLQHCDLVKFARYGPTAEETAGAFKLTREFVQTTRSDDKQIDLTDTDASTADTSTASTPNR